jgi:hypothetical protein
MRINTDGGHHHRSQIILFCPVTAPPTLQHDQGQPKPPREHVRWQRNVLGATAHREDQNFFEQVPMHSEAAGESTRLIVTFRVNICVRSSDVRGFEQRRKKYDHGEKEMDCWWPPILNVVTIGQLDRRSLFWSFKVVSCNL